MSKGGSRCGAGRPAYKVQAEHLQRIDIRVWRKRGLLWDGGSNAWSWWRGDQPSGSIRFTVGECSIRLNYSAGDKDASQTIQTTTTPCAYGGSRRWFSCPTCTGRCEVLFMRSGRFACRSCQRVSYRSQSGSEHDRLNTRYHRLNNLVAAGKPKWQRWATFDRLEDKLRQADYLATRSLMYFVERLTGKPLSTHHR